MLPIVKKDVNSEREFSLSATMGNIWEISSMYPHLSWDNTVKGNRL